jgi:peptide/nickel transport system ATP-binding protein
MEPLLKVENLSLTLPDEHRARLILDDVSLELFPGEVLGLVGESGSGKSMTALAIMGLLPHAAKTKSGQIWFDGVDLLQCGARKMRAIRGSKIAMVFQNPRAALNPIMRVGKQVARVVRLQDPQLSKRAAYSQAVELLSHVGIADAATRARAYPHQMSGGMAQRVLIAMMLACQPQLLIADEPTTGLDVTIQAQIFELIKNIQAETGATLLLITHDLGVVAEVCQRVAVMYGGQIMEVAPIDELFAQPQHPYTQHLMDSRLRVDLPSDVSEMHGTSYATVQYGIAGCRFANRCPHVFEPCWEEHPKALFAKNNHRIHCHYVGQESYG